MCIRDRSLAAYIAFYSNDIQERTADGLICKRPAGNTYKSQDDAWALDFYYAHKDDTAAQLVKAVLTNTQMWDRDLTKIEGLEAAVLADVYKRQAAISFGELQISIDPEISE